MDPDDSQIKRIVRKRKKRTQVKKERSLLIALAITIANDDVEIVVVY